MYSTVWQDKSKIISIENVKSEYNVTGVVPLLWIEHCVECAAPLCYKTCKIFKPRSDNRCKRFENGVIEYKFPKDQYVGGQLTFRRWAKLESQFPIHVLAVPKRKLIKHCSSFNHIGYFMIINFTQKPIHSHLCFKIILFQI